MKISLIIAFYKDLQALGLIFDAMRRQTWRNFEVVGAEDNNAPETKTFLQQHGDLEIVHIHHPDVGRTKAAAQNKAVCAARGDYLIFIDGDCIPYSTFLEGHAAFAAPRRVLSGRRVNLPAGLSKSIRDGEVTPAEVESRYLRYSARQLMWDKEVRFEQGIRLDPNGWLYKLFLAPRSRNVQILGCNFSCYKKDFVAINGFDESYGLSILGDDTDLNWRFRDYGAELRSCKNVANVFHLDHARPSYDYDPAEDLRRFNERKAAHQFFCERGISQY